MAILIRCKPLTAENFAEFGDVLDTSGDPDKIINMGMCGRYHDRAKLDFGDGHAGISLFKAEARTLPFHLPLVERHPQGSQAFIPMTEHPFVVVTASDMGDRPGMLHAFMTAPHQGINFHRGTWHGVLTPIHEPGLFAVIDRIGDGANLEEYALKQTYYVGE